MYRLALSIIVLVMIGGGTIVFTQKQQRPLTQLKPSPTPRAPGDIELLDGYVHEVGRGIDAWVGTIRKENGLEIRYDVGPLAGNGAAGLSSNKEVAWYKVQFVRDDELWVTSLKNGYIVATFVKSDANFIAKPKTQEELSDFFLMLMSFKPDPEYILKHSRDKRLAKPDN